MSLVMRPRVLKRAKCSCFEEYSSSSADLGEGCWLKPAEGSVAVELEGVGRGVEEVLFGEGYKPEVDPPSLFLLSG